MKKITRTVYMTKDAIDLIDKDINASQSYTVYANKEEGTVELDITLSVLEEFSVSEDVIDEIMLGLFPALSEKELEVKTTLVKNKLRISSAQR
jgi:hypothetical protein